MSNKPKGAPSIPAKDLCYVTLDLKGIFKEALIDTGSSFCLLSSDTYQLLKRHTTAVVDRQPTSFSAISAAGEPIRFKFVAKVHFKIQHLSWSFPFFVTDNLPVPILIGSDFLTKTRAVINMCTHTLSFPYGSPNPPSAFPLICTTVAEQPDHPVMGENLTPQQRRSVSQLISQFPDTITNKLGRTDLLQYHIKIKEQKIIRNRPYQYAPPKLQLMRQHIDDLLKKGVIRPSSSQYASAAFLVPKSGGKTRMVVDYRDLNSIIELDATPMPTIESAFQHLGQARWFTLLDLNSAYNQIPLAEASKQFTSFVVPWAQYEFNFLPFGLASGSMVLTSLIDKIFGDIKFKFIYSFLMTCASIATRPLRITWRRLG